MQAPCWETEYGEKVGGVRDWWRVGGSTPDLLVIQALYQLS